MLPLIKTTNFIICHKRPFLNVSNQDFSCQSYDKNWIMFYLRKIMKKVFAMIYVCGKVLGKGLLWRNELENVRFPPH